MSSRTKTISISGVPAELLPELEEWAAEEHRDRSSQIVKVLEDAAKARRAQKAKQKNQVPSEVTASAA